MIHGGLTPCLFLTLTALAGDPPRQEVSLNGSWEQQLVAELAAPPNGGAWRPCTVPGYLRGANYQRAWLRRSFTVPSEMRGQRIKIHFGGVKYDCRVLVNNRHVGGCFGGYQPFDADVTDAVRLDGPNELLVGCHDWTGVFSPGKVDFNRADRWDQARSTPQDKILSPVGGLYGLYGIWDDVTLRSHPAVYVKDLFIKPSVGRGELVVEYTLANESAAGAAVDLRAAVEDKGSDVLELPSARVEIAAGKTASVTLRQPWPKAPLWSHADPHLLHLRSRLSSGDVLRTRFGFREFWAQGHDFYLNGSKIHLLATSWWPPHGPMKREEIRSQWEAIKRCGCVAFRTHTQPWPSLHYEVADEIGLLMIIEGAVWNDDDTYRINDPVFWNHYAEHLQAMVARDKNRPSVVMWSLENEFFGGRLNDSSPAKADLVRVGRLVKQWDPTRPIFYESDGDPGGVADAIGIHYPHEYPDFTCWPNEAWWLAQPQKIEHMFLNGRKEFFWQKDKPLYVGEFLWLPSRDPSWHTVFFGDEAYVDYNRYRNLAKAEAWKMQILGYRHFEVAGISPWTVIEGGPLDPTNPLYQAHQYAYQPIAAYCHDYDSRFYAGEKIARRVEVFNDVLEPSTLELDSAVEFLTNPPAVAVARRGKGMVVLDQLRWDTEPQNARKAARYAASLLAALGGDFTPRLGIQWFGIRRTLTPEQKAEAAEPFGAEAAFLSAGKKLLDTAHPSFKAVTAVRNKAVTFWRSLSLPYPEPGIRLIRQDRIDQFAAQMGVLQQELAEAVQSLQRHYSELKATARQKLGHLYHSGDYPESLVGLFSIEHDFPSVEPPDYLQQLHPALYEEECRRVQGRFDEAVRLAEEAFIAELARLLSHLAERLSGQEDGRPKVFRNSAVENLAEFFQRFRELNVRSNAELDQLVAEAQRILRGVEPQDLRDNAGLRRHVASEVSRVQSVLDGLLVDRPRRNILRRPR